MVCRHCGTENKEDAKFCRGCGQSVGSQQPAASLATPVDTACIACGASVTAGARFCRQCGHDQQLPAVPGQATDHDASPLSESASAVGSSVNDSQQSFHQVFTSSDQGTQSATPAPSADTYPESSGGSGLSVGVVIGVGAFGLVLIVGAAWITLRATPAPVESAVVPPVETAVAPTDEAERTSSDVGFADGAAPAPSTVSEMPSPPAPALHPVDTPELAVVVPSVTKAPEPVSQLPQPSPPATSTPIASPAPDTATIVAGMLKKGRQCMTQKNYTCAMTTAENVLQFEPRNATARALRSEAKQTQEDALNRIEIQ